MTTEIQPVPEAVLAAQFPTNADRQAGEWNQKAKAWADSENAMVERTREIALTAHTNATAAHEQAQAADSARIAAQAAAADAQTAADAAAAPAGATKWDAGELYPEGAVVWSPIDMQTYRRREAGSGGADPSLDDTIWEFVGGVRRDGGEATDLVIHRGVVNGLTYVVADLGSVSGATEIDLSDAQEFTSTITGNTTFSFSNAPAAGQSQVVYLRLTNAGAYTITWPAGTMFAGAEAPTLTASGVDLLGVKYDPMTGTYMVFVIGLEVA